MAIDFEIFALVTKSEEYFGKTKTKCFVGFVFICTGILLLGAVIPILFEWSELIAIRIKGLSIPSILSYFINTIIRFVFYLPAALIAVFLAWRIAGARIRSTRELTKKLLKVADNKYNKALELEKESITRLDKADALMEESKRLDAISKERLEEVKAILPKCSNNP